MARPPPPLHGSASRRRRKGTRERDDKMEEGVRVVHASPGRVRLKVAAVKDSPAFAEEVCQRLATVRGVRRVSTNSLTGSVLVVYDAAEFASPDSLFALADSLNALLPGTDVRQVVGAWLAQAGDGKSSRLSPARHIASVLGEINAGVGNATGGVDLKVLLPVTLFVLGVRGLFVAKPLPVPTWYDLLWFALGTFVMLNRDAVDGDR